MQPSGDPCLGGNPRTTLVSTKERKPDEVINCVASRSDKRLVGFGRLEELGAGEEEAIAQHFPQLAEL